MTGSHNGYILAQRKFSGDSSVSGEVFPGELTECHFKDLFEISNLISCSIFCQHTTEKWTEIISEDVLISEFFKDKKNLNLRIRD